jgi:excisionase family DNA binding protein
LLPTGAIGVSFDAAWRELREDMLQTIREEVRSSLTEAIGAMLPTLLQSPKKDDWLTVSEAAEVASVSEETIRTWIKTNELTAVRPRGGRIYRIKRSDLEQCLRASVRPAQPLPERIDSQVHRILSTFGSNEHPAAAD